MIELVIPKFTTRCRISCFQTIIIGINKEITKVIKLQL